MNNLKKSFFYFRFARCYLPLVVMSVGLTVVLSADFSNFFYHATLSAEIIFGFWLACAAYIASVIFANYVVHRAGRMIQDFQKSEIFNNFLDLYWWENVLALGYLGLMSAYALGDIDQRALILDFTLIGINLGMVYWFYLIYKLGPEGWKIMTGGKVDKT